MRFKLVINGVDFGPWIKEDGITQSPVERQARSVVTLDGTLYKKSVEKRAIHVDLVELRDSTLAKLTAALTPTAAVDYTDIKGVDRTGIIFHISPPTATGKTVRGSTTFYQGVAFDLEEK